MSIDENYKRIKKEIPPHVTLVVVIKQREKKEIEEVINAGATNIGENYIQEAQKFYEQLGQKANKVKWHMIGSLQKNKINKALKIFDVIQTVNSYKKAQEINNRAEKSKKDLVPIYLEINIGNEDSKTGINPNEYESFEEYLKKLIQNISKLKHVKVEGLMTIGPRFKDPEKIRPYFKKMKKIFDKIKELKIPNTDIKTLSMGMTNSYKVAIEEGSNMVRIGTAIFGKRK